ncbi:hypothetical protein FG386_002638 [Cryptosporidium ryanae]|uniref:uncharacterized protein n=1 Tax=Cryptosporidium ryanae TaxID=515981 RepID=UPI00351A5227|nr:hypothetical protein FG386_002638 [Cryptosporidium ryanae]
MQNWEITNNIDIHEGGKYKSKEDEQIFCLITESEEYNYDENIFKKNIRSQIENINSMINKINKEKTELINSFPSCSLGIIKNLTQINSSDEDQMEIDQLSISNSDIMHSNDSPIFDSQLNIEMSNSMSDSPANTNIPESI